MIDRESANELIATRCEELKKQYTINCNKVFDWIDMNKKETLKNGIIIVEHEGVKSMLVWYDICDGRVQITPTDISKAYKGYDLGLPKFIQL